MLDSFPGTRKYQVNQTNCSFNTYIDHLSRPISKIRWSEQVRWRVSDGEEKWSEEGGRWCHGEPEGRFSLKVTSEQIWRRQGSRPCRHQGTVFRGGGTQWEGSGAHQEGEGGVKRERRGGELREGGGDCPGLCSCSENLAFSSWERWEATRRSRTNECQDLTSERSIRWLWGQTAGRPGGLGWGAVGGQICMRGTREKKREQRLLRSHWPGRVGLLLLKMRKTVDGVKEQLGKLGRGRGWRGGGIWCGMWLLSTRAGRSVGWGNTNSRAKSGWTHTRTHICVYMYVYEWPAYTGYLKLWNWVWKEGERAKLNLKVYEDWQVKRPRKLPELRRREQWGRRTVKTARCAGV